MKRVRHLWLLLCLLAFGCAVDGGPVGTGVSSTSASISGNIIDVQNIHETFVHLSGPSGTFRANSDCTNVSGLNLTDSGRYGSVRGLSEIMR